MQVVDKIKFHFGLETRRAFALGLAHSLNLRWDRLKIDYQTQILIGLLDITSAFSLSSHSLWTNKDFILQKRNHFLCLSPSYVFAARLAADFIFVYFLCDITRAVTQVTRGPQYHLSSLGFHVKPSALFIYLAVLLITFSQFCRRGSHIFWKPHSLGPLQASQGGWKLSPDRSKKCHLQSQSEQPGGEPRQQDQLELEGSGHGAVPCQGEVDRRLQQLHQSSRQSGLRSVACLWDKRLQSKV